MERTRRARRAGAIGVAAGVLWLLSWVGEAFLESDEGSATWYVDQILATSALLGTAVLMYGLAWTRSGGDSRAARVSLTLSWIGWALLALGGAGLLAAGSEDPGLLGIAFPLGGTLSSLAGLVGAVIIATRGELTGWPRWMPLVFAGARVAADVVQVPSDENTPATYGAELVTFLLIILLGVALRSATFLARPPLAAPAGMASAEHSR